MLLVEFLYVVLIVLVRFAQEYMQRNSPCTLRGVFRAWSLCAWVCISFARYAPFAHGAPRGEMECVQTCYVRLCAAPLSLYAADVYVRARAYNGSVACTTARRDFYLFIIHRLYPTVANHMVECKQARRDIAQARCPAVATSIFIDSQSTPKEPRGSLSLSSFRLSKYI